MGNYRHNRVRRSAAPGTLRNCAGRWRADDYRRMVDYVHASPVSHGMCRHAADWPWSSVHRFLAEGWIAAPGGAC